MNVELLQKVKAYILEEPRRLRMRFWLMKHDPDLDNLDNLAPPCGTVACIAGTICLLKNPDIKIDDVRTTLNIMKQAAGFAGLNNFQCERLFYASAWPSRFRNELDWRDPGTKEYAEVTARRIDHFIETEGRE